MNILDTKICDNENYVDLGLIHAELSWIISRFIFKYKVSLCSTNDSANDVSISYHNNNNRSNYHYKTYSVVMKVYVLVRLS